MRSIMRWILFLCSLLLVSIGIIFKSRIHNAIEQKQALKDVSTRDFLEPRLLDWLAEHPYIRISYAKRYKPLYYKDNKWRWQRVSEDYFAVVSDLLGVSFDECNSDSQKNKYQSLSERECDICVASSDNPLDYKILPTQPYLFFRLMIFSQKGSQIKSLGDLSGKTVATKYWNGVGQSIVKNYPQVKVRSYSSSALAFRAVENSQADAALMILPKGVEMIENREGARMMMTGSTDFKVGLVAFVRDDWPELVEILNKTIDFLDLTYRPSLEKVWYRDLGAVSAIDKRFFISLPWAGVCCLVVLFILYYAKVRADRKALEEKQRSEEKSRFFASVSHDLRNPLALMVGMLELIDEKKQDAKHREYIQTALYSSNTLLNLLNQVLDFSQMNAGKMKIYPQAQKLKELISNAVKIYQLTQGKAVTFHYTFLNEGDMPEWVFIDELRLQQVLSNLVGNALKFTEKGSVSLEVKWLSQPLKYSLWSEVEFPSIASCSGYLVLDIHDTGAGMESEKVEQLFQPYAQESYKGARPKGNGFGLGLSICKDLINLMGGEIKAHSSLGKGSTFSVLLPLLEVDQPLELSSANLRSSQYTSVKRMVLVVDDDAVYRKLVKIQCENLGAHVLVAESGEEALKVMMKEDLFCVFMDVEMIGLSGRDTVRLRRDYEKTMEQASTQIIALTGHTHINAELIEEGFDQVYTKPISKKDLEGVLLR